MIKVVIKSLLYLTYNPISKLHLLTMDTINIAILIMIILICLLAIVLVSKRKTISQQDMPYIGTETVVTNTITPFVLAGAERKGRPPTRKERALQSKNLVVDTLNLTHWLKRRTSLKTVDLCDIIAAIDETAPVLRKRYTGRVIFVTKDRETRVEKEALVRARKLYQATARRNGVYINIVERLPGDAKSSKSHAAFGRDDFYLIMLAWKLNCPVLSRDRFRDLCDMKTGHLDKFHVYAYSPVKDLPDRDYVNPAAAEFSLMRRPALIDYSDILSHQ